MCFHGNHLVDGTDGLPSKKKKYFLDDEECAFEDEFYLEPEEENEDE